MIWIDGDSCPRSALKTILDFASGRGIEIVIVSDSSRVFRNIHNVRHCIVAQGKDAVDEYILEKADEGDVVFTMDLYLSRKIVRTGRIAINHKGRIWKIQDIENRIDYARIMYSMKSGGMVNRLSHSDNPEFSVTLHNSLLKIFNI